MKQLNNFITEKLHIHNTTNIKDPSDYDDNLSSRDEIFLQYKIYELSCYMDDKVQEKIEEMANGSLLVEYWLYYILDGCKTFNNKYNDISKVKINITDKFGLLLYYDNHYLGVMNNINIKYPITTDFLKDMNLLKYN